MLWLGALALPVSAALAQAPATSSSVPPEAQTLPAAPSAVLQQAAKNDLALSKTAGSGAVFTPSAVVPGPQGAPAGLTIEQPTPGPLPLSLDDAISFGFARNVRLKYDQASQREVKGLTQGVFANLIPNLQFIGQTSTQELNLAAMGFKPQLLSGLLKTFNIPPGGFSTIVKVNTTEALISANQQLFNVPDFELWRGAKSEAAVVDLNYLNSRGDLVTAVAQAYLQVLADQANVADAQAQEAASKRTFSDAQDKLQAGVGTRLDMLRGQVDYQQRQQDTVSAQNQLAKDIIQLNRIMGLPAGQQLQLTDTTPYAEFADMDLDVAMATALAHRKDYLALQATIDVDAKEYKAVKYQRLPTLAFNGFYGVLGETTGMYHGVFQAEGSLRFPIFREAAQRGEQDIVSAQLTALRQRLESTRLDMEAQIRSAMLDVQAASELVKVAQANVDLTQQELSDERDRFSAGIDDNLPVIDAEAAVTGAQAQLVRALYQYNVSKLNLARNTGVVESRYRTYLGK
jgi:outer membrane protein TolC